ncbi:tetratricopeptide repeat protein [Candidatus Igneacidithiobacillus taiwanensis]|uniref:tetratricopeptide repeat protein n=1 Tax=Candidatus Igneacidithiobacillus taiwanensis TaxID=1945924 RepID=UPI0028983794|nr:tetratricopeptide repeat protein [Candidatus Igneacidithiobacillus taiwanensis]
MGSLTLALVLLIPVAFALGWWAAAKIGRRSAPTPIPRIYVQGLGHLLGERNDEAVKAFLDALRQYPESSDLLLALGRLFRRRGELERALGVHQHLLEQQDLDVLQQQEVLLEIARDYLKAGILNRAESILRDLLQRDPGSRTARELLAEVYELGADWEQAIRVRQDLQEQGGEGQASIIALLYCEMAEEKLHDNLEAVQALLVEAERADASSPRLALLRGRIAHQQGNWVAAASHWSTLLRSDHIAILGQVLDPFLESLQNCGELPQCQAWRKELLARASTASLLSRLVLALRRVEGEPAVIDFLRASLLRSSDLLTLQFYLRAGGDPLPVLSELRHAVTELPLSEGVFQCHHCGYQTIEFYWRCPSCRRWGTFRSSGEKAACTH